MSAMTHAHISQWSLSENAAEIYVTKSVLAISVAYMLI